MARIVNVFTVEEWRRQGVARELVPFLERRLCSGCCQSCRSPEFTVWHSQRSFMRKGILSTGLISIIPPSVLHERSTRTAQSSVKPARRPRHRYLRRYLMSPVPKSSLTIAHVVFSTRVSNTEAANHSNNK